MMTHYPNLGELFGTYFHQDWREDSASAIGVIERYLSEWPPAEIREAAKELHQLLAEPLSEAELADQMKDFGSFYHPQADGFSYRDWLRKVYQLLGLEVRG